MIAFPLIAVAALLGLAADPANAQSLRQTVAQWTDTPPIIDGKLDDPAWRLASEESGFVIVGEPSKRSQAPTYVKILTDGKALYMGFRCVEPKMDLLRTVQKKHDDPVWTDDTLEIILDPDNLKQKLYHLIFNSNGVQYDAEGRITLPESSQDEAAWNGKWESACSRGKGEWQAECRLPFDVFGISMTNGACVGFNLGRGRVGAHREDSCWAPTRIEYVNPSFLGELYLSGAGGQTVKTRLPGLRDLVRGSDKINMEFTSMVTASSRLRWETVLGKTNRIQSSGTVVLPANRSIKTEIPLSLPQEGDCTLKLTVWDENTGCTLYNGLRCFKILPEIQIDEALYALGYQRAEAKVTVHLPPKAIRGAHIEIALMKKGEASPLAVKTATARTGEAIDFQYSLAGRTAGEYALRARLIDRGQTLASAESQILPFTPNPAVGLDKDGFLTVENKPFFPVGLYTIQAKQGSHDAIMAEAQEAGFNSTVFYAYTVDTILPLLDAAALHNLRAFVYPANPFRVREHTATRDELVGEIRARMHHPALLGWYLVDEPEGIGVSSVQTVRDYYQLVKETDPGHPCSLVIMSPGAAANYGRSADIVWIDPYPVPQSPVTFVSESMDGAKDSVAQDKPVWAIPQAFDWSVWKTGNVDKIHRPTPQEERCMTYLALVHGAKGIIFWAHTASKYYIRDYPEHWVSLKKIAGELRDLSPALLTLDAQTRAVVSPGKATLDTMVKEWNGQTYVFAVNREPTACEAGIRLEGMKPASPIEVLFENRTIERQGGGWTDQFGPLEVHVYRFKGKR